MAALLLLLALWTAVALGTAAASSLVVLVHLHPPIDYAPQSRFSRFVRREVPQTPSLPQRHARRERVQELMQRFVSDSQASVRDFIHQNFQSSPHLGTIDEIAPLWIQNTLVVRVQLPEAQSAADAVATHRDTAFFFEKTLQWIPGVQSVELDYAAVRLLDLVEDGPAAGDDAFDEHAEPTGEAGARTSDKPQNNIELLHASDLWTRGVSGKGVVVANIDSGVRYTHETLRNNFRGASLLLLRKT